MNSSNNTINERYDDSSKNGSFSSGRGLVVKLENPNEYYNYKYEYENNKHVKIIEKPSFDTNDESINSKNIKEVINNLYADTRRREDDYNNNLRIIEKDDNDNKENDKNVSKRDILKKSAAIAGGIVGTGAVGAGGYYVGSKVVSAIKNGKFDKKDISSNTDSQIIEDNYDSIEDDNYIINEEVLEDDNIQTNTDTRTSNNIDYSNSDSYKKTKSNSSSSNNYKGSNISSNNNIITDENNDTTKDDLKKEDKIIEDNNSKKGNNKKTSQTNATNTTHSEASSSAGSFNVNNESVNVAINYLEALNKNNFLSNLRQRVNNIEPPKCITDNSSFNMVKKTINETIVLGKNTKNSIDNYLSRLKELKTLLDSFGTNEFEDLDRFMNLELLYEDVDDYYEKYKLIDRGE